MGSKAKGEQCPKVIQLIIDSMADSATILVSNDDHYHKESRLMKAPHGIYPGVKELILKYKSMNLKVR